MELSLLERLLILACGVLTGVFLAQIARRLVELEEAPEESAVQQESEKAEPPWYARNGRN